MEKRCVIGRVFLCLTNLEMRFRYVTIQISSNNCRKEFVFCFVEIEKQSEALDNYIPSIVFIGQSVKPCTLKFAKNTNITKMEREFRKELKLNSKDFKFDVHFHGLDGKIRNFFEIDDPSNLK